MIRPSHNYDILPINVYTTETLSIYQEMTFCAYKIHVGIVLSPSHLLLCLLYAVHKRKVTSFRFNLRVNCFLRNYPASASVSCCIRRCSDEQKT